MTIKLLRTLFLIPAACILLASCGFFDTDNTPTPTPLTRITPEAKVKTLWYTSTSFGVGSDYLKLAPSVNGNTVFTAGKNGTVAANDKTSGKNLWKTYTNLSISASPTAQEGIVVVGTRHGDAVALDQTNGNILWKASVSSEVLAPPAISNDIVIIKTIDGKISALSKNDGHVLWNYQQTEPTLILRSASAPQISRNTAIIGFANGNLAHLTLKEGSLLWQQTVAVPEGVFNIQRMVDIDADPIVLNNRVYAATYQGKVGAFDLTSGKPLWTQDTSSYAGIAADDHQVYVSDAKSTVTAFNAESGAIAWRQSKLEARNITGPVIMDDYIVIGDEEGYLHWISRQDGHFIARVKVGGYGILATPVVSDHVLYVTTQDGHIAAYTLS